MININIRKGLLAGALFIFGTTCTPDVHAGILNKAFQTSKIIVGGLSLVYFIKERSNPLYLMAILKLMKDGNLSAFKFLLFEPMLSLLLIGSGFQGLRKEQKKKQKIDFQLEK